jgi:hypothetical protein
MGRGGVDAILFGEAPVLSGGEQRRLAQQRQHAERLVSAAIDDYALAASVLADSVAGIESLRMQAERIRESLDEPELLSSRPKIRERYEGLVDGLVNGGEAAVLPRSDLQELKAAAELTMVVFDALESDPDLRPQLLVGEGGALFEAMAGHWQLGSLMPPFEEMLRWTFSGAADMCRSYCGRGGA